MLMGETGPVPDTAYLRRDYGSGRLDDQGVAATWREQFDRRGYLIFERVLAPEVGPAGDAGSAS